MPPPAPPSLHRRSPTPPPPCAVGDDADGRYDPRLPPCAAAMLERRRRSTHRGRSALSQIQWGRPTPNPSSPLPRGRDAAPGPDTASSFFLASSPDYRLQLPAAINADCLPQLHDHQGDETMLRLSRFLPSASRRGFDIKEAVWSGSLTFQQALSTSAANLDENSSGKKFASYTVFKGKAALSIHPILPSFSKMESGASRMNRNGSVMLTFFPAVGQRKYDYTKKQDTVLELEFQGIKKQSTVLQDSYWETAIAPCSKKEYYNSSVVYLGCGERGNEMAEVVVGLLLIDNNIGDGRED